MKKLITLFVTMPALVFCISCKDDPEISASIVGTWQGDHMEIKATYLGVPVHQEEDDQFNSTLQFNEDGTVSFTKDGDTTTGTYELNGSQLTTNVDFQVQEVELSEVTFDVVELTATKLKLHLDRDQEVEVPDIGPVTANIKADLAFDRL